MGLSLPAFYYFSFLGLVGVAWMILKYFRNNRIVVFSLGFFVVTIMFNLPIGGVGYSMSGDRFTYLPYLGLFLLIAYCSQKMIERKNHLNHITWMTLVVLIAISSYLTFQRCKVWKNDGTLWAHVIKQFPEHSIGYDRLAEYSFRKGNYEQMMVLSDQSLRLNPKDYIAYFNKGNAYLMTARPDEAFKQYSEAIRIFPYYHHAYKNRGVVLFQKKEFLLALENFNKALSIQPNDTLALLNRGKVHYHQNNLREALVDFKKVLELEPTNHDVQKLIQKVEIKANDG
jgi:tetratricopeptide (TPR) repeat protein